MTYKKSWIKEYYPNLIILIPLSVALIIPISLTVYLSQPYGNPEQVKILLRDSTSKTCAFDFHGSRQIIQPCYYNVGETITIQPHIKSDYFEIIK